MTIGHTSSLVLFCQWSIGSLAVWWEHWASVAAKLIAKAHFPTGSCVYRYSWPYIHIYKKNIGVNAVASSKIRVVLSPRSHIYTSCTWRECEQQASRSCPPASKLGQQQRVSHSVSSNVQKYIRPNFSFHMSVTVYARVCMCTCTVVSSHKDYVYIHLDHVGSSLPFSLFKRWFDLDAVYGERVCLCYVGDLRWYDHPIVFLPLRFWTFNTLHSFGLSKTHTLLFCPLGKINELYGNRKPSLPRPCWEGHTQTLLSTVSANMCIWSCLWSMWK